MTRTRRSRARRNSRVHVPRAGARHPARSANEKRPHLLVRAFSFTLVGDPTGAQGVLTVRVRWMFEG